MQNSSLKTNLIAAEDAGTWAARGKQSAARTNLLRMTQRKWRFVQIFEALGELLKPLTPPLPPAENPTEPPASILVVDYWNLGDLAILVPFLRNLRRSFPNARIALLLNPDLTAFIDGQGLVDELIPACVPWARHFSRWRKYNPISLGWISLARTILTIRKHRFDWAFSGRMDVRDNFLLWLSGARRRIGYGIGGGGSFLTDCVTPDPSHPHRADVWLRLLQVVNVSPALQGDGYRLMDADMAFSRSYLCGLGIPSSALLVGVHPGARVATRRWGEDRFAEVARRLVKKTDAHILWFSEPGNSVQMPRLERCHSVSLDFRAFLALLSRCYLLVCNDSGPMHLANLLGVPVVAVFGPQRPEWFGPRGPQDRVVIHSEFSCRPCFDYCIFDQPYCLRTISVEEVYEAIESQITSIRKSERTRIPLVNKPEWVSHAR